MSLFARLLIGRYTERQYRAVCTCGWRSEFWDDEYLSDEAWLRHKRESHRA